MTKRQCIFLLGAVGIMGFELILLNKKQQKQMELIKLLGDCVNTFQEYVDAQYQEEVDEQFDQIVDEQFREGP